MTFSLAYVIALVLVIVPCTRLNIVNKSILLNTTLDFDLGFVKKRRPFYVKRYYCLKNLRGPYNDIF